MDAYQKKDVENKSETAGFLSKLFFAWIIPLFWKGRKKNIDIDDLDNVPAVNQAVPLSKQLQEEWDKECASSGKTPGKRPNLFNTFLRTFGGHYFTFVTMFAVDCWLIRVSQPVFLKLFVRSFLEETASIQEKCAYAAGVCLSTLFHILLNHPCGFQMCVSGMKCRVAVSSMIYQKALRLSKSAEGKSSVGQIVNLLSNDVSRFDYNLHFIAYLFVGPVQLALFTYLLFEELGVACMAGVGFVLFLSPGQYLIGKLSARFRVEIASQTDERSRIMSEIIVAMRLIKMYAWEKPFAAVIQRIRQLEVKALKKRSYLRASYMGVFTSNFTFVPFLAIFTYGMLGNYVTPDKAFFAMAIFQVMTEVMMYYVPNAAASVGELRSSVKRIEEFLLLEEQRDSKNLKINEKLDSSKNVACVKMNNVCCRWDCSKLALEDLSLNVSGDKLIMVVGPVGCGKTSMLQCLLSELPIDTGFCEVDGRVSYASQEAWIFPATVRQNILLGKKFIRSKYEKILDVCALKADLEQFANDDMTIVGERGVSLSGGQKARINLARGLYQDADIYLLDDPLSAVDTRVSRHIFEKCIQTHLRGKLRILVTHQLQYLPQADHVIVLNEGTILAQGKYSELVNQGVDFVHLLAKDDDNSTTEEDEDQEASKTSDTQVDHYSDVKKEKGELDKTEKAVESLAGSLEAMQEGAIGAKTYWQYFKAGDSLCRITFLASAFVLNQILISGTDYWLSIWTSTEESRLGVSEQRWKRESSLAGNFSSVVSNESFSFPENLTAGMVDDSPIWIFFENLQHNRDFFKIVYAILACLVFLVDTSRTLFFFDYTMRISCNIHNKMFRSLVNSPIKFFDENASGRIMNRFTKDIGTLDEFLPLSMFDTFDIGHRALGCIIVVLILNYYLIIPACVLFCAYAYIRNLFIKTSRNVKRVETCTRSPLYTHLSSSVQGLSTIRCLKAQQVLIKQFDNHQDVHSAAWFHFLAGNNWFSIWLELCSTIFIAVVVYSFVLFAGTDVNVVSKVGLAVALLLQLMNIFQFGMRQSSEMENFMTSVERALEYTKLEPEQSTQNNKYPKKEIFKIWPSKGGIRFRNVYLTYDGESSILKNLTFEIKPEEKIGIVGRTGAGKSSIISALFRMTEPAGEITIDGFDIAGIPLEILRKHISIIPQDPVLFSGTIRYNLDPFGKFTDSDLWRVIEEVELKELIHSLDYSVNEGGKNFSVGQRQLVCLARAILKNNKIIVLDEATANVDPRTDSLIQQTIKAKFSNCSIITIAHRLQTVMDCDKILVLDHGHIMEYDQPHILLENEKGYLQNMIAETGSATQQHLKQIAQDAYNRGRSVV